MIRQVLCEHFCRARQAETQNVLFRTRASIGLGQFIQLFCFTFPCINGLACDQVDVARRDVCFQLAFMTFCEGLQGGRQVLAKLDTFVKPFLICQESRCPIDNLARRLARCTFVGRIILLLFWDFFFSLQNRGISSRHSEGSREREQEVWVVEIHLGSIWAGAEHSSVLSVGDGGLDSSW